MARSTIANRRKFHFDKLLELRDLNAAAISATTNGAALAVPATLQGEFKAIINVLAHTGYIAGTAQWSIAIQASADNSTWVQVGNSIVANGTLKIYEIALSGGAIESLVPDAGYLRVVATRTGTPGNLSYGAFLSPC